MTSKLGSAAASPREATLQSVDPEIDRAIRAEIGRQQQTLELIASENFVSEAVLEAMGSPLTNKYAEGYPGKRYYGGCEFVDQAESLAIERAKSLFGAEHANVQPHSGSQANSARSTSVRAWRHCPRRKSKACSRRFCRNSMSAINKRATF